MSLSLGKTSHDSEMRRRRHCENGIEYLRQLDAKIFISDSEAAQGQHSIFASRVLEAFEYLKRFSIRRIYEVDVLLAERNRLHFEFEKFKQRLTQKEAA